MLQLEFETKRLLIREVVPDDAPQMQTYQSEPDQWQFQAVEPEELADAAFRIEKYIEHRGPDNARRLFVFVGIDKVSEKIVGHASISRSHPAIGSLGFGIDKVKTGEGLATEFASELLRFGFEDINLNRLDANVAVENQASIRVLEKLNMKFEGVNREVIWAQGRWWNEAVYAMIASEYQQQT